MARPRRQRRQWNSPAAALSNHHHGSRGATPGSAARPVLPAGVTELLLPSTGPGNGHYAAVLYGAARVQYADAKRGIDHTADVQATVPFASGPVPVDWDRGRNDGNLRSRR